MAEEGESGEKTEDPTEKKLRDAREKGDIPKSQEVNSWFIMAGSTLVVAAFATNSMAQLSYDLTNYLENAHLIALDPGAIKQLWTTVGEHLLIPLVLPMAVLLAAGLLGNLVQSMPILSTEPLIPKLSKISPAQGFKRLFSAKSLVNFAKGVFKISAIAVVLTAVAWPYRDELDALVVMETVQVLPMVKTLTLQLLGASLLLLTIIAFADFAYEKYSWMQKQKMSLQEVKEEYKQTEGDPVVKGRIRQIRMQRARSRMMAAVPEASVIVTNPTHYSVALKYEQGMQAPMVIAKGVDEVALRIRIVAKEHDIPIYEAPPLARALYATVEVDQEIPEEQYKAVANVISFVMKLRKKSSWRN